MKNWSEVSRFRHDIKNPLTSALVSVELLKKILEKKRVQNTDALELIGDIESDLEYIGGIGGENFSIEKFSPDNEIKKIINRYKGIIKIDVFCPKNLRIKGDLIKFRRVMFNLFDNAKDAKADFVKIEVTEKGKNKKAVIVIYDNGCGIPKENLSKIFENGFSTKSEKNSGLGLFIVKEIVEKDFGGSIEIESNTGKDHGTRIIWGLPLARGYPGAGVAPDSG